VKGLTLIVSRIEPQHFHVPDPVKEPKKGFDAVLVNLKSPDANGIIVFPHLPLKDLGATKVGDQFKLVPVKAQEEQP